MNTYRKLIVALCLALVMSLTATAAPTRALGPLTAAQAASKIKLNQTKATIYSGKTLKLKVVGTTQKATWSSSNTKVAAVNASGVVTAIKAGEAIITAKVGKKTLTCKVTVKSPLSADPDTLTLKVGESKKVTLTWQLKGKVSLKRYDASVIKCEMGGKWKDKKSTLTVTGVTAGTETLKLKNSKTDDIVRIKVTVKDSGGSDIVDKTSVKVEKGKTVKVRIKKIGSYLPVPTWDPFVLSCEWGEWDGSGWPFYITGLEKEKTEIIIHKGEGGEEVARIKVTVK